MEEELSVKLAPGSELFDGLSEMIKLAEKATFIVTRDNKIQILISKANLDAFATLDMESDQILCNLDDFSFRFDLKTWIQALRTWILPEPHSSLFIRKSLESIDLFCEIGENRIKLGEAEFVKQKSINLDSLDCQVKVAMKPNQFTELIHSIIITHDNGVSAVQMHITRCYISYITPARHHHRNLAEEIVFDQGLKSEGFYKFKLRWDVRLFEMLSSMSIGCLRVEISVLVNPKGCKLYRFRFFFRSRHVFCYVEKEPCS